MINQLVVMHGHVFTFIFGSFTKRQTQPPPLLMLDLSTIRQRAFAGYCCVQKILDRRATDRGFVSNCLNQVFRYLQYCHRVTSYFASVALQLRLFYHNSGESPHLST